MSVHDILEEVTQDLTFFHRERYRDELGFALLAATLGLDTDPLAVLDEAMEAAKIPAPERSYYRFVFRRALDVHAQELVREVA